MKERRAEAKKQRRKRVYKDDVCSESGTASTGVTDISPSFARHVSLCSRKEERDREREKVRGRKKGKVLWDAR